MATIVTSTIGSGGGRDYSTLQAWENACPANLVTDDKVWKGTCYNDSEFTADGATLLTVSGITTDATRYVWLTTASGQSFKDDGSDTTLPLKYDQSKGVGFRLTGQYTKGIECSSGIKLIVEGIQLYWNSTSSWSSRVFVQGDTALYRECIIQTTDPDTSVCGEEATSFTNCTVIASGSACGDVLQGGGSYRNCTIVRPSDLTTAGVAVSPNYFSNYPTVINCAVFGAFTTMFGGTLGSYGGSSGYNASSVGTGSMPGSNNVGSLTLANQFENTTNASQDWRPKSGNGLAAGTRDQTNTSDLDIIGAARSTSTPTIGAREVAASGVSTALSGSALTSGIGSAAPGTSVGL
jgi:hypothetical protein